MAKALRESELEMQMAVMRMVEQKQRELAERFNLQVNAKMPTINFDFMQSLCLSTPSGDERVNIQNLQRKNEIQNTNATLLRDAIVKFASQQKLSLDSQLPVNVIEKVGDFE